MAILQFTYCSGYGTTPKKVVYYDDVQHLVVDGEAQDIACKGTPPETLYSHVDNGVNFIVYPQGFYPYAYVQGKLNPPPTVCNIVIDDIAVTDTSDGFINGVIVVEATSTHNPIRYKLDNGSYQDSNAFVRVRKGDHIVTVRDAQGCEATQSVNVGPNSDLAIDEIIIQNATANALGSITVIASGSQGPFQYQLRTGIFSYQSSNVFENLEPGSYTLNVKDAAGVILTQVVYVSQDLETETVPFINVPIANTLRFVVPGAAGFDGLLHMQEEHEGFYQKPYYLPVQQSDPTVIQIQSSYDTNVIEVINALGEVVKSIPAVKKTDYTNNEVVLPALLRPSNQYGANTDCYFADNTMPDFIEVGMLVQISGTTEMNGVYEILEVNRTYYQPYFRIDRFYQGMGTVTSFTATFNFSEFPYDVHEYTIDWTTISAGKYSLKMKGTLGAATYELPGEPIDLKPTQKGTVLLTAKNVDNNYGIDYSTGITHVMRVSGRFHERRNPGQRKLHRDSKNSLVKISAYKQRAVRLQTYQLPAWVHEKLEVMFDLDYFTVNGVEYQTEEEYDVTWYEDHSLADAEISVTQKNDFYAQNGDDSGDVDTAYLKVNEGFLKI